MNRVGCLPCTWRAPAESGRKGRLERPHNRPGVTAIASAPVLPRSVWKYSVFASKCSPVGHLRSCTIALELSQAGVRRTTTILANKCWTPGISHQLLIRIRHTSKIPISRVPALPSSRRGLRAVLVTQVCREVLVYSVSEPQSNLQRILRV